jgi:hypothetical protein
VVSPPGRSGRISMVDAAEARSPLLIDVAVLPDTITTSEE